MARRLTPSDAAAIERLIGHVPEVLAVSRSQNAVAAVLADYLVFTSEDSWNAVKWTDIQHGGWDADTYALYWSLIDGTDHRVILDQPFEVPRAFADRVTASIVVRHEVAVEDGHVMLVGRRQPGSDEPLTWQATSQGADLNDPKVAQAVVTAMQEVRAQYE